MLPDAARRNVEATDDTFNTAGNRRTFKDTVLCVNRDSWRRPFIALPVGDVPRPKKRIEGGRHVIHVPDVEEEFNSLIADRPPRKHVGELSTDAEAVHPVIDGQ